jgi:hypothetical protein
MANGIHPESERFSAEAAARPSGTVTELYLFLRHNKKWWLTPIVLVLLLVGGLLVLGGTAAAPFIYTLF